MVFQYVILFKILVLTVPNKLALQFILGSPCYSRFPPKVGYFLLLLQEFHIYQQLKVLLLVLIEIPRRQQDIGSIDRSHITQLSVDFAQWTFWRRFALSRVNADFTGNISVIGVDRIKRVVRLTVFEAIPQSFSTEY